LETAGADNLRAALDQLALGQAGAPPAKKEALKPETAAEKEAREALAAGLGSKLADALADVGKVSKVAEQLRRLGRTDSRAGLEAALAEAFAPHQDIVEKALERLCAQKGV